jgi:pimeloyl-ACP methyl ester carboxylesterase
MNRWLTDETWPGLAEAVNADPEFRLAARYWNGSFRFGMGAEAYVFRVRDGRVADVNCAPTPFDAWDFEVSGPPEAWREILAPVPRPFFQDVASAVFREGFSLGGDLESFFAYHAALRRLVAVARRARATGAPRAVTAMPSSARFADVTGRYVYLTVDGVEYRVYFEEAGSGIPLLLQHTAGSDGRQWRHLLEDEEITRHFRLIAHDLPFHGKSLPPASVEWWKSEYRLTQDFLMKFVVALSRALELDRPVYMGCSMGGHLAGDLALHHPDEFRAVIGVEGALASKGSDAILPWFHHPRLSNDSKPSLMYTLMAPQSPEAFKQETIWAYSQGAPAVFKGDLHYYAIEHDLTATAHEIDTSRVAVYLLGGEYDWSATPQDVKALADRIPGADVGEMKEVGHFPMSENPAAFRRSLMPILERIRGA